MSLIKRPAPLPGWGPAAVPSQEGWRHKEALSPAKRRPLRLDPAREEVGGRRLLRNPSSPPAPSLLAPRSSPFSPHSSLVSGCCLQGSQFSARLCVPSAPSPAPSSCSLVSCRQPGEWPSRKAPQAEKGLVAVHRPWSGGGRCRRPRGCEGGAGRPAGPGSAELGVPKSGIESLTVCVAVLLVIVLRSQALRRACRRALISDVCLPALCRRVTHRPDLEQQHLIRSFSG